MSAPTVGIEHLPSGQECLHSIRAIEKFLSRQVTSLYSAEIGGSNGLIALIVSSQMNIPCLDCDGMGRAFPQLDHSLSFIEGQKCSPTCLSDVYEIKFYTIIFEIVKTRSKKRVLAVVPNLITIIDCESGDPYSTENIKFGCRVSVLVLPSSPKMTTERVLKVVGPKAFGYSEHEYSRDEKYQQHRHEKLKSVWDVYY
ncbi:unnamed protein product [Didymodactylos carnosus]|uniref:Uncharacterized protein n=1 Tax=Didymodactylos carnosus TaxID=1234261 RepID=A0A813ZT00_9BILA|nr:unnamed protein product [Didymodactylos carnosus]CAF0904026.1 unnamed protein product [Didymodactylos carnosus]CAF3680461.1 unnamed protein product [Didymodactylos carnosus]CAF3686086.1 unnamed protein product [Didymodactylos carnosus]